MLATIRPLVLVCLWIALAGCAFTWFAMGNSDDKSQMAATFACGVLLWISIQLEQIIVRLEKKP